MMDSIIKFCAKDLIFILVLVFLYAAFKTPKNQRKQLLIALILAGLIAAILDKLAGKIYYDPRPFVAHNVKPLISHSADNGFPSEHTVLAATLSTLIYFYRKQLTVVAFALTLIIGISRIAAHVHSPIDIVGGLAIGGIAGKAGYYLAVQALKKLKELPAK